MAIQLSPAETNIARIVQAIRQLINGRVNSTGIVTLRTGQVTTVVSAPNCGVGSRVFLSPRTAGAAALSPPPYVKDADVLAGSFTITHSSSAVTTLDFAWDARG